MRRRSTNAYEVFIGESILADLTVELLLWVLIRRMMAWSHQCKAARRRLWWGRQTLQVMGIEHRLEPRLTFRFSQNCWYLFILNFFRLADRKNKRPPSITNEEEGGWTTTFGRRGVETTSLNWVVLYSAPGQPISRSSTVTCTCGIRHSEWVKGFQK